MKLPRNLASLLCFASFVILGFVCIYPIQANKDPTLWSAEKSALFVSLSRPAFLFCLVMLFYLLFLGHANGLKKMMCWRVWTIGSRLSYLIYLVFPIVAGLFASSMHNPLYLTYSEMLWMMVFNIVFSTLFAIAIYLFFEHQFYNPIKK